MVCVYQYYLVNIESNSNPIWQAGQSRIRFFCNWWLVLINVIQLTLNQNQVFAMNCEKSHVFPRISNCDKVCIATNAAKETYLWIKVWKKTQWRKVKDILLWQGLKVCIATNPSLTSADGNLLWKRHSGEKSRISNSEKVCNKCQISVQMPCSIWLQI